MILIVLFLWWTSPQPIVGETQHALVTGGIVQTMTIDSNGQSGMVWVDAPMECVTLDWSARTTSGNTIRTVRVWRNGCYKAYLPL